MDESLSGRRRTPADGRGVVALELAQHGLQIDESPIQDPLRHVQQVFQQRVGHGISRCRPALLCDDDPTGPQTCQLLRHDWLTDPQRSLQIVNAALWCGDQHFEQPDTNRMGEGSKELGLELLKLS
jgi:hypothetical protein